MVRRLLYSSIFPADRSVLLVIKTLKIRIYLNEVENTVQSSSKQGDYFRQSTPVLEYDNTQLRSGPAIAGFLVNLHDRSGKLYPKEPTKRALVDQIIHFNTGVLLNTANHVIRSLIYGKSRIIPSNLRSDIQKSYDQLENMINSPWLAGDTVSLGDLSSIPSIATLDLVNNVSKKPHAKLHAYLENCQYLPHYKEVNQEGLDRLTKIILEKFERSRQ